MGNGEDFPKPEFSIYEEIRLGAPCPMITRDTSLGSDEGCMPAASALRYSWQLGNSSAALWDASFGAALSRRSYTTEEVSDEDHHHTLTLAIGVVQRFELNGLLICS